MSMPAEVGAPDVPQSSGAAGVSGVHAGTQRPLCCHWPAAVVLHMVLNGFAPSAPPGKVLPCSTAHL